MRITYRGSSGKLIHVSCEVDDRTIERIKITGDFFLIPEESIESLETTLIGTAAEKEAISNKVAEFFSKDKTLLGATPEDFVRAILLAAEIR